jgi:hypothetical protein
VVRHATTKESALFISTVLLGLTAATLVGAGALASLASTNRPVIWPVATAFGLFLMSSLGYLWAKSRGKRLLSEHNFLICTHCRFPLDERSSADKCPECGAHFEPTHLKETWKKRYIIPRQRSMDGE